MKIEANGKDSESVNRNNSATESQPFASPAITLKDKPDASPIIVNSPKDYIDGQLKGCKDPILIKDSSTYKIYHVIRANPEKAFTRQEFSKHLNKQITSMSLTDLSRKKMCFRLDKIPNFYGKTYGTAFLYSYSEKSLWKRAWDLTPKEIQNAVMLLLSNPNMIFSQSELMQFTKAERYLIAKWIHKFYNQHFRKLFGFPLIKVIRKEGIATFYCSHDVTEEKFQNLYERYYKEKVIKRESIAKLDGNYFEEFTSWVWSEYLKLKGFHVELQKVDREPCDYIAKVKLDLSDTLTGDKQKEIIIAKFILSCKNWRLDRPLNSKYIIGMSGSLREGLSFTSEPIFQPRNCIGVILCTRANHSAWKMASELGIYIFDLQKILHMYEAVKKVTGKSHKFHENISMKAELFHDRERAKYKAMKSGGLDVRIDETD